MKRNLSACQLLCCLLMAGCVSMSTSPMNQMTTALPKLTSAIEAVERWAPQNEAQKTHEEILAELFAKKPELKAIFAGVQVKWRTNKNHEVDVLICSPDGKKALLEDASWTPQVDHVWYRKDPTHPAEFSLIPAEAER